MKEVVLMKMVVIKNESKGKPSSLLVILRNNFLRSI